ncbi:hypothetical protein EK21DRAFT_89009 [Setomelanomma holmii]|uniref:Uncharacterized protein n=1 Tax=Setomelanomma holmii TaxID=210430 RepID=A0A9P4LNX2_9PLEO|nr:hypothetical protein EK21DRAFT_89009 [Setomelanomma holmii]
MWWPKLLGCLAERRLETGPRPSLTPSRRPYPGPRPSSSPRPNPGPQPNPGPRPNPGLRPSPRPPVDGPGPYPWDPNHGQNPNRPNPWTPNRPRPSPRPPVQPALSDHPPQWVGDGVDCPYFDPYNEYLQLEHQEKPAGGRPNTPQNGYKPKAPQHNPDTPQYKPSTPQYKPNTPQNGYKPNPPHNGYKPKPPSSGYKASYPHNGYSTGSKPQPKQRRWLSWLKFW